MNIIWQKLSWLGCCSSFEWKCTKENGRYTCCCQHTLSTCFGDKKKESFVLSWGGKLFAWCGRKWLWWLWVSIVCVKLSIEYRGDDPFKITRWHHYSIYSRKTYQPRSYHRPSHHTCEQITHTNNHNLFMISNTYFWFYL